MDFNFQMTKTGTPDVDRLIDQAQQAAQRSGLTAIQEFSRLLRASPAVYEKYLAAHPAQTGGR